MSGLGRYGPLERAGFRVRELVRQVAVSVYEAVEVEEPIESIVGLSRAVLDEPLAGVAAARLVFDVAAGQLREWALRARGAGRGWDDIAEALDLGEDDPVGRSPGEVAWEWLIEHRPPHPTRDQRDRPASAVWTCTTCRGRVRDSGPYEPHPEDRERGHAAGCARQAAALEAWRLETGWDTEEDR